MAKEQKKNVISLPRDLVEYILLGPTGDRRQLQDSPILVDVWIAFAKEPNEAQELLITPLRDQTAGVVAAEINDYITREADDPADIAYLQGIIAARLYFDELLKFIVPLTRWWQNPRNKGDMAIYLNQDKAANKIKEVLGIVAGMVQQWSNSDKNQKLDGSLSSLDRYAALAGLILWAGETPTQIKGTEEKDKARAILAEMIANGIPAIAAGLSAIFTNILQRFPLQAAKPRKPLVYEVSLNRAATMAVARSVPAVKADAARFLFAVNCSSIAWAIIDSGIQGDHKAFLAADGETSRVNASFDFSNFRKIVSLDNPKILKRSPSDTTRQTRLALLWHKKLKAYPDEKASEEVKRQKEQDAIDNLIKLAEDAKNKRPLHWEAVRPFIEIAITTRPELSDHGTHVAGILGARRWEPKPAAQEGKGEEAAASEGESTEPQKAEPGDMSEISAAPPEGPDDNVDGVCPDIQLYDFRVLAPTIKETEFAIIAALQYIRYMNEQTEFTLIHGANLSLSIPHDVRNYACGRTPVCVECERLVDSGVVVVAAAGNYGYQTFQTQDGFFANYAACSITDPGNADGVITVGATHRYKTHTYGVSFFSSRGPTGDGRLKPDLVAPGERIHAPFRDNHWGDLDGTSMAAPHVSGAAAMLMARFSEFIGNPRRIKAILCQSATDLGRERSFQGYGMLDVLRAFQSI